MLGVQRLSVASRFLSAVFAPLFGILIFAVGLAGWSCFCAVYTPFSLGKACLDGYTACSTAADHKYPTLKHTANPITSSPVSAKPMLTESLTEASNSPVSPPLRSCLDPLTTVWRAIMNRFRRLLAAVNAFGNRYGVLFFTLPTPTFHTYISLFTQFLGVYFSGRRRAIFLHSGSFLLHRGFDSVHRYILLNLRRRSHLYWSVPLS